MNQKKIGEFIFNLRVRNGLSQTQLANLIPVTRQAVSSWELVKSISDINTLLILSKIFAVSIDKLLEGNES